MLAMIRVYFHITLDDRQAPFTTTSIPASGKRPKIFVKPYVRASPLFSPLPPLRNSSGKVSVCCVESLTVNEHTSYDTEAKRKTLLSNLTLVISCALSSDLSCSLFRKIFLAEACNLVSVSMSKRVDSAFLSMPGML